MIANFPPPPPLTIFKRKAETSRRDHAANNSPQAPPTVQHKVRLIVQMLPGNKGKDLQMEVDDEGTEVSAAVTSQL